jgi:hypothetical protein
MKDQPCVSYEMAKRLEAEGFFFNPGSPFQTNRFIWAKGISRYEREKFTISYTDPTNYPTEWEPVYAPTAFDVIPLGWCVEKKLHAFAAKRYEFDPFGASETPTFIHENPHDAAAMAWLWEKENGA